MGWLQGLELLVTVLLARNRPPPLPVAAGVPRNELAAELLTLPSGLLAMVCEAVVKLKVRLTSSFGCVGHRRRRGPTRSRSTCTVLVKYGGQSSPLGAVRPYAKYYKYYLQHRIGYCSGFRCGGQSPPRFPGPAYGPFAS